MNAGTQAKRDRFRELHETGTFLMPNAWDVGSARLFQSLSFPAVATTSSGHAATLGRGDQNVTLDELVDHVAALATAVDIPLSVDAEYGFSESVEGLAATIERISGAGAAGISIEDYIPGRGILESAEAVARVRRFVEAARGSGLVVTARAEAHLYGPADLEETVARLKAFAAAGADCVYAPGLRSIDDIARVVAGATAPVNVLLMKDGPPPGEMERVGVRRLSTGGALAFAAYGAVVGAARTLATSGLAGVEVLPAEDRARAFD